MNLREWFSSFVLRGFVCIAVILTGVICGCSVKTTTHQLGYGWDRNSVNTVIFRNAAIISHSQYQFVAYYDTMSRVVVGRRLLNSDAWQLVRTPYSGNTGDAHNSISLGVDGEGYVHMSWDQHDTPLRYVRSLEPNGLEFTAELKMTDVEQEKVTYPGFHKLNNGNLLFCYRSGQSGFGNLVMKLYDIARGQWENLHLNLIDGEGQRNAYWQMHVDEKGIIHISWVWRESWDVSTNHDICYAKSMDDGMTWLRSDGSQYLLPITANSAEVAWPVSQNSNLINQTSMCTDSDGNPFIATYWNEDGETQYRVVYYSDEKWRLHSGDFLKSEFDLGGGGTKRIPVSRPEIIVENSKIHILYRDENEGNRICIATFNMNSSKWKLRKLTTKSFGQWEPNFDEHAWRKEGILHVYAQYVEQADNEGLVSSNNKSRVQVIEVQNLP